MPFLSFAPTRSNGRLTLNASAYSASPPAVISRPSSVTITNKPAIRLSPAIRTSACVPDFVVLVYPAYLSVRDQGEQFAPELTVSSRTPPTFLVQAEDDHIFVEGTLLYYRALKRANVPAEMHLYPTGGHGYGLRPTSHRVTGWPNLAADWLRSLGLLQPAATTAHR